MDVVYRSNMGYSVWVVLNNIRFEINVVKSILRSNRANCVRCTEQRPGVLDC